MTPYNGVNPFTPSATPTGYGVWTTVQVIEDGDKRSGGNLSAAGKSLEDQVQWIGWRTIDQVSGGSYTFTTTISTRNVWIFANEAEFIGTMFLTGTGTITAGATMYVGDPGGVTGIGHVVVTNGSDVTAKPGGIIVADGTGGGTAPVIAIKNGGVFTSDATSPMNLAGQFNTVGPGVSTLAAPVVRTGTSGYTQERTRKATFTAGALTIANPTAYDVIYVDPTNATDGILTLGTTSIPAGVRFRICMSGPNGPSGQITVIDGTDQYAVLNPGGPQIGNSSVSGSIPCAFVDMMAGAGAGGSIVYSVIGSFGAVSP
jgi:hypothetical protein